jgi:hypothetical protein
MSFAVLGGGAGSTGVMPVTVKAHAVAPVAIVKRIPAVCEEVILVVIVAGVTGVHVLFPLSSKVPFACKTKVVVPQF